LGLERALYGFLNMRLSRFEGISQNRFWDMPLTREKASARLLQGALGPIPTASASNDANGKSSAYNSNFLYAPIVLGFGPHPPLLREDGIRLGAYPKIYYKA
jgi:hypothetical protein